MSDGERFDRMLPCKLSHDEVENKGKALAHAYDEYCRIEEQKKAQNSVFKEQLDAARDEMGVLRTLIKTGYEARVVTCVWVYEWSAGKRAMVRQDTGQVVDEQAIPAEELQTNLSLS